jgi:UDP-N-acetylglucosamine transferase subunit ALG13
MKWVRSLDPAEFRTRCAEATLLVSHAGMGTVITASEMERPLIVMPRRADLMEVTSDHQLATAAWLRGKSWIRVADDERALAAALDTPPCPEALGANDVNSRDRLIDAIGRFIDAD